MDSLGNIAIDRIFGGRHNEMANDIVETSDGGALISSITGSYGPDSIFGRPGSIKTHENADSMSGTVLSRVGLRQNRSIGGRN
ncbi:MAG: hypothetical protein IPP40_08655 [bacterium]|nr:hypothetical protein [bacterium]